LSKPAASPIGFGKVRPKHFVTIDALAETLRVRIELTGFNNERDFSAKW